MKIVILKDDIVLISKDPQQKIRKRNCECILYNNVTLDNNLKAFRIAFDKNSPIPGKIKSVSSYSFFSIA